MKKLKNLRNSLLFLVMLFAFNACTKYEHEQFEVTGDVVFIKKIINEEIVSATAYYAYGNDNISSTTVTLPYEEGTVELEPFETYTYTFISQPEDVDFTINPPIPGNYSFEVTSTNDETIYASDDQEYVNMGFAENISIDFDENINGLSIEWDEISDADTYIVRIFDTSDEMIFNSPVISANTPEYFISGYFNNGTWSDTPVNDEDYILKIESLKNDADVTVYDYVYNVQEITITEQQFTWELE